MNREIKELFKAPTFYIAISLFAFLCGLKFYGSIVSFMELSSYYPQVPYGSEKVAVQGDIYELAFAPFYRFVGSLLVIIVPIISSFACNDRLNNIDKIDLLGTGVTEMEYVFKKIFVPVLVFSLIILPVVLFPLSLLFFIQVDFINIITTFFALFFIIVISSSLSIPLSMFSLSAPVTIFVNVCLQVPLYLYFFERQFLVYFVGVVRLQALIWTLSVFVLSAVLSKIIYRSMRLCG